LVDNPLEMSSNLELLRKIQDGAVSSSVPVSELLRRCQVLAVRIGLSELGEWVRYELNGYPPEVELPAYRVLYGVAKGHFLGPFGSGLRNATLPASNLPAEYRDWGRKAFIRQPIVALEEVATGKDKGPVHIPWPGDLVARVQDRFMQHMTLAQAWLDLARSDFVSAVESVRNRVLSFALDAEQYVKDDTPPSDPARAAELSNVFHTHIYGSVGNLAQGSTNVTQTTGIPPGDLQRLLAELRSVGVPNDDVQELEKAVQEDGTPPKGKLGPRVAKWLGGMLSKAVSGTWSVATSTATEVLPKLIERYYDTP
jgi:hypothetical protein